MQDDAPVVRSAAAACKLSVMLKAYNHEPFIAQAIESALAQRTSFPVEILIGEDCSTDRTRQIVMEYARKYSSRIRVLAHGRNLGMTRNTMELYRASRGEYVAWLDGDDYWTYQDKLQRQVEFLDANPEYTLCFHDTLEIKPDGSSEKRWCRGRNWTGSIEDMLFGGRGPSVSAVYRKVLDRFPEWFAALPYSDWALQVLHAERGKVAWLPQVYGVHRDYGAARAALVSGATGKLFQEKLLGFKQAEVLGSLNRHFDFRYADRVNVELLRLGAETVPLRMLLGTLARPSRLRKAVWNTVKTRPRLARWLLVSANAIARLILRARAR